MDKAWCWYCIGWRGIALTIGCATFVPVLFALILAHDHANDSLCIICSVTAMANLSWLYGALKYKSSYMLYALCWTAYLIGWCTEVLKLEKNFSVWSIVLIVYCLALLCYDSIMKTEARESIRSNQNSLFNQTQANQAGQHLNQTNASYNISPIASGDSLNQIDTKSLIMTVD
ncbi:uncharacterized protein LOC116347248 [Contarinia nasturtii]|uniref:uncharacterized protein LOC116347248 n=1 Tax=Contarinia nasturtii TaxID=265458 RepID=UPI0012D425A9|nr:uncharacterized protein LOC116347248 [Contarinia nasturtii]XP_031633639.1 uncharacterized protein LOC116347248 [Contarinia nasturtii]XP_031633640.1 uncharacterized protein LOC116347248 [Contarinia nasturtii]